MSYMKFNNLTVPIPSRGLNIKRIPQISTSTNANGQIVAQILNTRALYQFGDFVWSYLTAQQWQDILSEIKDTDGYLTFYDEIKQKYIKIKVLFSQSYEEPFMINNTGKPESYVNCQCSITDMGYDIIEIEGGQV